MKNKYVMIIFISIIEILTSQNSFAQINSSDSSSNVTDVWVVIKSHFDLVYTDLAGNVFQRYRTEMMDNALKVIDDDRKLSSGKSLVWTVLTTVTNGTPENFMADVNECQELRAPVVSTLFQQATVFTTIFQRQTCWL